MFLRLFERMTRANPPFRVEFSKFWKVESNDPGRLDLVVLNIIAKKSIKGLYYSGPHLSRRRNYHTFFHYHTFIQMSTVK